jgi:hypothetical protein
LVEGCDLLVGMYMAGRRHCRFREVDLSLRKSSLIGWKAKLLLLFCIIARPVFVLEGGHIHVGTEYLLWAKFL